MSDFKDDGGTPMWRYRRTITAPKAGVRAAWKRLPILQQAILVLLFGFIGPFAIIFGGVVVLAIWDVIRR